MKDVGNVGTMHRASCHTRQFIWQPMRYEQLRSAWSNYKEHVQHDTKQKKKPQKQIAARSGVGRIAYLTHTHTHTHQRQATYSFAPRI